MTEDINQFGRTIVIGSSFAADPLADSVRFWLDRMEMPAAVSFAPPFQLIQDLLDPAGAFSANPAGLNVALLRWEDLDRGASGDERSLNDVDGALRASIARSEGPHLIVVCPPSPRVAANARVRYASWDLRLPEDFRAHPTVWVVTPDELQALYPVADLHNSSYGEELAKIPYLPEMFAAIGTIIARKFHLLTTAPYKAIVVDCDETLWRGACGEEGARGVALEEPHLALQKLLVSQQREGVLICLCSKNNEADVAAVFRERQDLLLRMEHVAASRVNWSSKAENILSLADELGLDAGSFIFLDDSPVECEMMRRLMPNVLTLELPSDCAKLPQFLRRVWAFDRPRATNVDRERTALYQRDRQREQLKKNSATLESFVAGLELKVAFTPLVEHDLDRASQLTFRVNQFNLTTVRRTEAELADLLRGGTLSGLTIDVGDRFGDYGVVGLLLFNPADGALRVDTFLLSCRALGRGVEHRMLAELGRMAELRGLATVELRFNPTGKNQPARDFLNESLASYCHQRDGCHECRVPAEIARAIRYRPVKNNESSTRPEMSPPLAMEADTRVQAERSSRHSWIAAELVDAGNILAAVESWKQKQRPELESSFLQPRTEAEQSLAGIWAETLALDKVGVRDNFFQLGGDSLTMVRIITRLYEALAVRLPIAVFFEAPTIEAQAVILARLKPDE